MAECLLRFPCRAVRRPDERVFEPDHDIFVSYIRCHLDSRDLPGYVDSCVPVEMICRSHIFGKQSSVRIVPLFLLGFIFCIMP